MQLANKIKDDLRGARNIRLPTWALLCLIVAGALGAWLFDRLGRLDLALPTLNGAAVIGFIIAVKWKMRDRAWFWITIVVLASLQVPLILFVPWTSKWTPALLIAVVDSIDLVALLAILDVVAKTFEGQKTSMR